MEIEKYVLGDAAITLALTIDNEPTLVGYVPHERFVSLLVAQKNGRYIRKMWYKVPYSFWKQHQPRIGSLFNKFAVEGTGKFRIKRTETLEAEGAAPVNGKFRKDQQVYYRYSLEYGNADEIKDEFITALGALRRLGGLTLDELFE